MCTIFVAPKMRTELSADAVCYQDVKFRQREQTEDRKGQLSMKWVAVTDEHGNRKLRIRWIVARVVPPATVCKEAWPWSEPAASRESEATLIPQARLAIP